MSVGAHIKRVKVHENNFARYYGLQINHDQKKGTAWDCIITDTEEKIEFKSDFMAQKTGNHFLEFRYSNNEGQTWDDSGLILAAEQADYWVVYFGDEHDSYHWFYPKDLLEYVGKVKPKVKAIRRNLYGNSGKIRCEGWVVPLEDLAQLEIDPPIEPAEESNVIDLW